MVNGTHIWDILSNTQNFASIKLYYFHSQMFKSKHMICLVLQKESYLSSDTHNMAIFLEGSSGKSFTHLARLCNLTM
jgi:ribosomal protein S8